MNRFASCVAVGLLVSLAGIAGARTTSAGLEVIGDELVPPTQLQVSACRAECVEYKYHRHGSKCKFDRCNMKEVVVIVKDPCTCCCVEVPVCVPCCCNEMCTTNCHCGLFGREITEYCWDCGFRMEIVATKHGDFVVHYYGVRG